MESLPLRLGPGADLRRALEAAFAASGCRAAFAIGGIGSLGRARLRLAGRTDPDSLSEDLEILTLAGSLSADGAHLHMSVAGADGAVRGGHVAYGCIVRTTVEAVLVLLPGWTFGRAADPATGHAELVIGRDP